MPSSKSPAGISPAALAKPVTSESPMNSHSTRVMERVLEIDSGPHSATATPRQKDRRVETLTRRLAEKSAHLVAMSEQLGALQGRGDGTAYSMDRLNAEFSGQQEQARRLRATLETRSTELAHAEQTFEALQRDHSELRAQVNEQAILASRALSASVQAYSAPDPKRLSELASKDAAIAQAADQIVKQNRVLAERRAQLETTHVLFQAKTEELKQIQGLNQEVQRRVAQEEQAPQRKGQLQAEINHLLQEVLERNTRLVSLGAELAQERAASQLASTRQEMEDREQATAQEMAAEQGKRVQERLAALSEDVARKKAELMQKQQEAAVKHQSLQDQHQRLATDCEELHEQSFRRRQNAREAKAKEEISTRVRKYANNVHDMLTAVEQELKEKRAELKQKLATIERLDVSIKAHVKGLEDRNAEIERLHTELAFQKEQLLEKSDQQHLQQVHQDHAAQADRSQKLWAYRQELEEEYQQRITELEAELQKVEHELAMKSELHVRSQTRTGLELQQLVKDYRTRCEETETLSQLLQCLKVEEGTKDASIRAATALQTTPVASGAR